MADQLLQDMPWAQLRYGNNELKLRAKTAAEGGAEAADALAFRFQVPVDNLTGSGWLGAIFADIIKSKVERVQIKLGFVMDPDPAIVCYMTEPGGQEDKNEILVFKFGLSGSYIRGIVTSGGDTGGRFFATYEGRRLCFQAQADPASLGNLVIYDAPLDGSPWSAIGVIKPQLFPGVKGVKRAANQKKAGRRPGKRNRRADGATRPTRRSSRNGRKARAR